MVLLLLTYIIYIHALFIVIFFGSGENVGVLAFHDLPLVLVIGGPNLPLPSGRTVRPASDRWVKSYDLVQLSDCNDVNTVWSLYEPDAVLSIGPGNYRPLNALPLVFRRRWIHIDRLQDTDAFFQHLNGRIAKTMLREWLDLPEERYPNTPLLSVFSPTLGGADRLWRVFYSLRNQTYTNWEWVVILDDPRDSRTVDTLVAMTNRDARLRYYIPHRRLGIIGTRKREAAMLARGDMLLEVDHDDELLVNCLELVVKAFAAHPDVGFVYTDFSEPFYSSNLKRFASYGKNFPLHYYTYEDGASSHPGMRSYLATSTRDLVPDSLFHLVALPNHLRAWRADIYRELNGHRSLIVADDHELMLRTFIRTRWMHVDRMLYLQYRNDGNGTHDNFTFRRNRLIQHMCGEVYGRVRRRPALQARIAELGPGHLQFEMGYREEELSLTVAVVVADDNGGRAAGSGNGSNAVAVHADTQALTTLHSIRQQRGEATAALLKKIVLVARGSSDHLKQSATWCEADDLCDLYVLPNSTYETLDQATERAFTLARTQLVAISHAGDQWRNSSLESALTLIQRSCANNRCKPRTTTHIWFMEKGCTSRYNSENFTHAALRYSIVSRQSIWDSEFRSGFKHSSEFKDRTFVDDSRASTCSRMLTKAAVVDVSVSDRSQCIHSGKESGTGRDAQHVVDCPRCNNAAHKPGQEQSVRRLSQVRDIPYFWVNMAGPSLAIGLFLCVTLARRHGGRRSRGRKA